MSVLNIGDDISPFYSDPMQVGITIVHLDGDTYLNSTACGDKLTQLHKDLQRLDFPYFFVELVTTNKDIEHELETLRKLYSNEEQIIKYKIIEGEFTKSVYKGDTMCALPWIHKYVNPQGLVMPCCVGNERYPIGNINYQSLDEISTKPIRDQMLKGERPNACSVCWQQEDAGIVSHRHTVNKIYKPEKHFVMKHLDIRLSNKCNLMCRMCSGMFSNRIAQEEEKLYRFTKYKNKTLSPELVEIQLDYIKKNINTIESVYFAGGEPLVNDEHYRILNLLIDNKKTDIKISYNTNFSLLKFKKHNIIDYWSKFNNVIIGASIDLIGDQSSYVRHGVDYNTLESNYNKIKNLKNVTFRITSVLHLMNLYNLPKLQKRWIELGVDCKDITFNLLVNPGDQAITVLPEHYKNIALVKIHNHLEYLGTIKNSKQLTDQWKQARDFMKSRSDTHLLGEFFRLTDDKDRNRNQKFEDYFPEFKDLRNYA
jgi:MoaA/NifB/PqqE/SkfB family radical SAM enzyme